MDILLTWKKLSSLPFGKKIFSKVLYRMVPYTGTVRPKIIELREGYALATMKDSPHVRNHLKSVHAMALANLGELVTGIAVQTALPPKSRSILKSFSISYVKKARGTLTAKCDIQPLTSNEKQDFVVEGTILNSDQQIVATVKANWLVDKAL